MFDRIRVVLALLVALVISVGMSGRAAAEPGGGANICINIHGDEKVQKGSATCLADETSRAIAKGAVTLVEARIDSQAIAIGDGSGAFAEVSSTATVNGVNSQAFADHSSTAIVTGDESFASASVSSTATVVGDGSCALATNGSTVEIQGDNIDACT
jgi:hypothetical protein